MASVTISFVGKSPLLMHNIRLADPEDPITREIAAITSKRNKTDEDRRVIGRLEWFGSLYTTAGASNGSGSIVVPTGNLRRCLIAAARVSKKGTMLGRALHFSALETPLQYDGPHELDALYDDGLHISRQAVAIAGSRTMRVRPMFRAWRVEARAELVTEVMDMDALVRIVELAGTIEGLGDNRINGYGRFEGTVTALRGG